MSKTLIDWEGIYKAIPKSEHDLIRDLHQKAEQLIVLVNGIVTVASSSDSSGHIKRIGLWKERNPSSLFDRFVNLPSPADFVDATWDAKERQLVIEYLERKEFIRERYLGYASCRVCDLQDNGSADCSDDVYLWPEGLSHYLKEHSVKPPQDFIDHVLCLRV